MVYETNCHWDGCCKEYDTQDQLVHVRRALGLCVCVCVVYVLPSYDLVCHLLSTGLVANKRIIVPYSIVLL